MEISKRNKVIFGVGILLIIIVLIASSFAYWQLVRTQTDENEIATGCFDVTYTEVSAAINLSDAYPITDEEGMEGDPYTFTIKNTCGMYAEYQINLEILPVAENRLSSEYVRVGLNDKVYTMTSTNEVTPTIDTALESYKLISGGLKKNQEKTFDLRLWMDEDTTLAEGSNKFFKSKITVIAVAAEETLAIEVDKDENMIPVMWDGTTWVKADETNKNKTYKWYDYENLQWANIVLVKETGTKTREEYKSAAAGIEIDENDILAYYVYVPRYKYQLWNVQNGNSDPQEIMIEFQTIDDLKETGSTNGTWLTHPAFTFGDQELNGIWVGKFETSTDQTTTCYTSPSEANCDKADGTILPRIKPNVDAWGSINLGRAFDVAKYFKTNAIYGISSSTIDSHMMKNMEWGAVAYLSHSKYGKWGNETYSGANKEIYINNVQGAASAYKTVTGCSGGSPIVEYVYTCPAANTYEKSGIGTGASTTGTIYGVYDMSGGVNEFVMGNMRDNLGQFYPRNAVFSTTPEAKYYDSYAYDASSYTTHGRGLLGDATKETLVTFGVNTYSSWYSDSSVFAGTPSWFSRGGSAEEKVSAGPFAFSNNAGGAVYYFGFRSVLVG